MVKLNGTLPDDWPEATPEQMGMIPEMAKKLHQNFEQSMEPYYEEYEDLRDMEAGQLFKNMDEMMDDPDYAQAKCMKYAHMLTQGKTSFQLESGVTDDLLEMVYAKAYALTESRQFKKALTVLLTLMVMKPEEFKYTFATALTLHKMGEFEKAAGLYSQLCLFAVEKFPKVTYHFAQCLVALGKKEDAVVMLKKFLDDAAVNPSLAENLPKAQIMHDNLVRSLAKEAEATS